MRELEQEIVNIIALLVALHLNGIISEMPVNLGIAIPTQLQGWYHTNNLS
jgi:hypothetical protein